MDDTYFLEGRPACLTLHPRPQKLMAQPGRHGLTRSRIDPPQPRHAGARAVPSGPPSRHQHPHPQPGWSEGNPTGDTAGARR